MYGVMLFGFRYHCSGFSVQESGFTVDEVWVGVQGSRGRVQGLGCRV